MITKKSETMVRAGGIDLYLKRIFALMFGAVGHIPDDGYDWFNLGRTGVIYMAGNRWWHIWHNRVFDWCAGVCAVHCV